MSGRRTKSNLAQKQSLPLAGKIILSQVRIRDWYDHWDGEVYVSFSGGKDSTVLKHLVETTVGDVPSVFVNTGLEYPEIQKFAMSQPNVITMRPEMRFDEVIKKYGYPVASKEVSKKIYELRNHNLSEEYKRSLTEIVKGKERRKIPNKWLKLIDAPFKVSSKCCDVMKKKPAHVYEKETGKKPFIGTLAEESSIRKNSWLKNGCNAFNLNKPQSRPLSFWTEQDILEYIVTFNLPYAPIYGEILQDENGKYYTTGAKRTGCMFCMFGMSQDGCPNRFEKMKDSHPNQYKYCMKPVEDGGLGLAEVLDFMGERY